MSRTESSSSSWINEEYLQFIPCLSGKFENLNDDYFSSLQQSMTTLIKITCNGWDISKLKLCPVFSIDNDTLLLRKGSEIALIFNCYLGASIKQVFYLLVSGTSQDNIFPFLKDIVASSIFYNGGDKLGFVLKEENIPRMFGETYTKPEEILSNSNKLFARIPKVSFNEYDVYMDTFIFLHEIFHLAESSNPELHTEYIEKANYVFDTIYQNYFTQEGFLSYKNRYSHEFHDIYKTNISEEEVLRVWMREKELVESNKDNLISEFAADFFALRLNSSYLLNNIYHRTNSIDFNDIYALNLLTSLSFQYVKVLQEYGKNSIKEKDIKYDLNISTFLHFRINAQMTFVEDFLIKELIDSTRRLKLFDLVIEKSFSVNEIVGKMYTVQKYFNIYIQHPFILPLHYTIMSAKAKLENETINGIYADAMKSWKYKNKIWFVCPFFEQYSISPYLIR